MALTKPIRGKLSSTSDWQLSVSANLTGAVEFVHYQVGDTIQRAGGHSSTYLGVELKYAW